MMEDLLKLLNFPARQGRDLEPARVMLRTKLYCSLVVERVAMEML